MQPLVNPTTAVIQFRSVTPQVVSSNWASVLRAFLMSTLSTASASIRCLTALSRSAVYALMAESRFPKPIRIGSRAVRWIEQDDFIASRPRAGSGTIALSVLPANLHRIGLVLQKRERKRRRLIP